MVVEKRKRTPANIKYDTGKIKIKISGPNFVEFLLTKKLNSGRLEDHDKPVSFEGLIAYLQFTESDLESFFSAGRLELLEEDRDSSWVTYMLENGFFKKENDIYTLTKKSLQCYSNLNPEYPEYFKYVNLVSSCMV